MKNAIFAALTVVATSIAAAPGEGQVSTPTQLSTPTRALHMEPWIPGRPADADFRTIPLLASVLGRENERLSPISVTLPELQASPSTAGYILGGALAGALVGVGVLYVTNWDSCGETGSMCGLSIPLYTAAGAVGGGLVGYLIGRTRN